MSFKTKKEIEDAYSKLPQEGIRTVDFISKIRIEDLEAVREMTEEFKYDPNRLITCSCCRRDEELIAEDIMKNELIDGILNEIDCLLAKLRE